MYVPVGLVQFLRSRDSHKPCNRSENIVEEMTKNERNSFDLNSIETDGGENEMSVNFTLHRTSSTTPTPHLYSAS